MTFVQQLPRPQGWPFLVQLPHEVSAEILSYLPRHDLISTCLVSRHMLLVSQPLLYKAPCLSDCHGDRQPSLELLLRTLLSPGGHTLATYVRSLFVVWSQWDQCNDSGPRPNRQHPRDIPVLAAAATRLGIHQQLVNQDAQLMILLDILTRLKCLEVELVCWPAKPFSKFIEPHNVTLPTDRLPPGLQQLCEFRCHSFSSDSGVNPETLLTFFSLPHIRKIDVSITELSSLDFETAEAAAGSSKVTDLRLQLADRSDFLPTLNSPLFLTYILKIPAVLTHFAYYANNPPGDINFRAALQPLRGTLKSIDLRIPLLTTPLGSLREWKSLVSLKCSLVVLLGAETQSNPPRLVDMLPPGLLALEINCHQYWVFAEEDQDWSVEAEVDQEVELLGQKEAVVPLLQTLAVVARLEMDIRITGLPREVVIPHSLRLACAAAGVDLGEADCGEDSYLVGT